MNATKNNTSVYVVLLDIRSAYNVGSIFRTADAAGVLKIYCTGYTPSPIDRFGRARRDIAKAALGAEKNIPWQHETDLKKIIDQLRKENVKIIGVEQASTATDYKDFRVTYPIAFIFGNEVDGLGDDVLSLCDDVIEIPMHGRKESLNVSVSAGIILFHTHPD